MHCVPKHGKAAGRRLQGPMPATVHSFNVVLRPGVIDLRGGPKGLAELPALMYMVDEFNGLFEADGDDEADDDGGDVWAASWGGWTSSVGCLQQGCVHGTRVARRPQKAGFGRGEGGDPVLDFRLNPKRWRKRCS